ncbi:E3 ubiquitin-protein ligase highwire isoform X1 [Lutzomyia longipalpis]|uniref:E3 ubiquitin-protein ligase highwire isoform X1 n=1 Tax=Lutzomyia longipalpis TaxID=7200 RepID=UPI0024847174|nr:E3 ubiquitin-protein ligase highwire isoform X1 [Lutzomyia longipalpis]
MGILEAETYGNYFYEIFISNFVKKTSSEKAFRARGRGAVGEKKDGAGRHVVPGSLLSTYRMELEPNSSKFAVFSLIRAAVLEVEAKYALIYGGFPRKVLGKPPCCVHCSMLSDNDSDDSDESEETTQREIVQKVPQIVGAGLKSLFELIAEARNIHPRLCTRALKALLDIIQGQNPESFKSEPGEMINQLFDLLLDLATLYESSSMGDQCDVNNWSAIGCSALLGLCVARGDTGKILRAVTAMLMSPAQLSSQYIAFPLVLNTLQRSVIAVALNRPTKPDFLRNGIPKNCLLDQFSLANQLPATYAFNLQPSIASDGRFIYILMGRSLLKIGTGFNGTLKGYLYAVNNEFGKETNGWIGYAKNTLYYRRLSKRNFDNVLIVDTEKLAVVESVHLNVGQGKDIQSILFSDGESLSVLCTTKDDSLVVKQILPPVVGTVFDLPLKLARKTFRTLGYAAFEDEVLNQNQIQKIQSSYNPFEPKLMNDVEILSICCGKEFGLVRTPTGKVYYYGKAASLGLKSVGKSPTLRLTELIVSKSENIVHIAIGHDGVHAILVTDEGIVYFTGTARRGEDGDSSKNRRQPKAVKPKKIGKVEVASVVYASCNNGTSGFVTKNGKLVMYGKDTAHCDSAGFVTALGDQHIVKVSLGKAHCAVLNSKGQLFTFGLNNKGQCGRVFVKEKETSLMETSEAKSLEISGGAKSELTPICDPDDHTLTLGQCRVCSICRECTGYNTSCVVMQRIPLEQRVPGADCDCGHGCAGCSKCAACNGCINQQEGESTSESACAQRDALPSANRVRYRGPVLRKKEKKHADEANIGSDAERDQPRVAPLPPARVTLPSTSPVVQISCGLHHTVALTMIGEVFTFGSNQYGQLGTGDLQPVAGPTQVKVSGTVTLVAAGANHTVLMTHKGVVYTFGNYQKGQLGRFPNEFHQKDDQAKYEAKNEQQSATEMLQQRQKFLWNCIPGPVMGVGPNYGKRATWISASGDQTFIKIDESLVTGSMLSKLNIVADKNTMLLIPNVPLSFDCLTINRQDGTCSTHCKNQMDFTKIIQSHQATIEQMASDKCNQNTEVPKDATKQMSQSIHEARNQLFDFQDCLQGGKSGKNSHKSQEIQPQLAFTLEPNYGNLWAFDAIAKRMYCYNAIASDLVNTSGECSSDLRAVLSSHLALPSKLDVPITRSQASLNLLACLDILTSSADNIPQCFENLVEQSMNAAKEASGTDFLSVVRFENYGGGWGYSGHSVEAIRFMADTDVLIGGFGIFGGRGEYTCKLKLYDLGPEGGGYEKDGVLVAETEETPFECPARSRYNVILPKPVTASAGNWFLVWSRISGPSSDCGSCGQASVTTDDQVVFTFKSSKKANNGTDVNSGQIPSILYRVINRESKQISDNLDTEPIHKISKMFANSVTKECFDSLVSLLSWAWGTFKMSLGELKDRRRYLHIHSCLERLVYVNKSCLRLLRKYTNEVYPVVIVEKTEKKTKFWGDPKDPEKRKSSSLTVNKGASTSKMTASGKIFGLSGNAAETTSTPTAAKKANSENLLLAECIGEVRALLMQILCDDIQMDAESEAAEMLTNILDECHVTFVSCFNAFYPTSTLKWNCLCDQLAQMDRGILHSRLLSAILAGLCSPNVQLRKTFSLLTPTRERISLVSPSDNSGLPMLTSMENHSYPVLVEQMIYRTQQEKSDFHVNTWTFKDVLMKLLNIISKPIRSKIENIYHSRCGNFLNIDVGRTTNQGLIDNCCHLLARVLAEIVYESCTFDQFDVALLPSKSLQSTGCRYTRTDSSRTWNTGNFGPDAIAFSVDKAGIAIAGAVIYSGSGSYEYQLELLHDTMDSKLQFQNRWETLESTSGTYDQEVVQNDMVELKFDRPVQIKEHGRYAIRLCSQGARTCSGDAGVTSIRGPCGATFTFFPCDLSFNGTTPIRGQIPCLLYYSSPLRNENHTGKIINEMHARDTVLQIASDITKKCAELLILARNTAAMTISPSEKSPNSSNNTQTIDSEHNITPIEEHMDIAWSNNSYHNTSTSFSESNMSTARDLTKKIESFSKGIIETLKFEKRATNPFDFEIEIGATEINPKDLMEENDINDRNVRNGKFAKMNGNNRIIGNDDDIRNYLNEVAGSAGEDDGFSQMSTLGILELFGLRDASMFHTLLPLVFAHIGPLVNTDPRSCVQILSLIRDILPHVAALNQLHFAKDAEEQNGENVDVRNRNQESLEGPLVDLCTTSKHYCTVESDHPYKSAMISCYKVEFPPTVQWFSIEFDPQSGTAQPEDALLLCIPKFRLPASRPRTAHQCEESMNSKKSVDVITSYSSVNDDNAWNILNPRSPDDENWIVVKKFNTPSQWNQNSIILPGNCLQLSLETATNYLHDQQANRYGFKCQIVGYENPSMEKFPNSCLIRLEHELAYLGGMCSANLMKKDLVLPGDKCEDLSPISEMLKNHAGLLGKGFALPDSMLTINQALDSHLPIGSHSNERQFLKDFVTCAPGSSGARLAAWLQPEPRLDTNKCELKSIIEPIHYGWPTQLTIVTRDQYGDLVLVADLRVEITAIPVEATGHGSRKMRRMSFLTSNDLAPPPKIPYEPTMKDRMCYKAITFMKAYEEYSFEELRFVNPIQTRIVETLTAKNMEDGTFAVAWTPNSVGNFCLTVTIDGIPLENITRVEVKEAGIPPPPSNIKRVEPPNKLRRFRTKNSAGLRIRAHPTLQSEQVGIIKMDGIISYIDEVENDDGVWVRLSTESIRQHCTNAWYPTEAWCLQYNQHIGKMLLHPVVETTVTKCVLERIRKNSTTDSESFDPETLVEPQPKHKISSPSKKGFDFFSSNKFTPPLTSDLPPAGGSPFVFQSKGSRGSLERQPKGEAAGSFSGDAKRADCEASSSRDDSPRVGNLSQSPNQSTNLGSTIAGVVGGGASKLQALSKWFKGDSVECKDFARRKSDFHEFASVSVRDIVKAIGGQDSTKSNGNGVTPPCGSRSSSPVAIPQQKHPDPGRLQSAEDFSSASPDETVGKFADGSDYSLGAGNFAIGTNCPANPEGSSPKRSPRKSRGRKLSPGIQQLNVTDREGSINQTPPGNDKSICSGDGTETDFPTRSTVPKKALPPALAESLRAVFAAFLWHEGIVHDAMACASFLKFHPTLSKQGAVVVTRGEAKDSSLTKEQKAQQRHSVEVANAGNYLNIRPSTLEALAKSGNSSVHNRRRGDKCKLHALPEIVTVLPPALRCLVYLWEQLCLNCVQLVQSNALATFTDQPAKESPPNRSTRDVFGEFNCETRKGRKKKKDEGSYCEMCEIFLPIPVTYHMRIVHPGCGKSANGKGYNSVGTYCKGWAGNCGDGGKGATSWYLLCEKCRDKNLPGQKNINLNCSPQAAGDKIESLFGLKTSLIVNSDIYTMMKENALFLLELSSNGIGSVTADQKRSPQQIPIMTEDQVNQLTSDMHKPSTSRGDAGRESLNQKMLNRLSGIRISPKDGRAVASQSRGGHGMPGCLSPELLWPAPEMFSCLESLGASLTEEILYNMFEYNSGDNGFDRPLSEMSFDSIDQTGTDILGQLNTSSNLKFHRSYSMGQGWNGQSRNYSKFYGGGQNQEASSNQIDSGSRVVLRRRNNSTCDSDAGSLLLCYPSNNLRKLVPDEFIGASCVVQSAAAPPQTVDELEGNTNVNAEQAGMPSCSGKKKDGGVAACLMSRPVMAFILKQHDLTKLRFAMKRSLRVATCRIYSLQALNWLMRTVTQTICLHDLMWWFVTSLTPVSEERVEPDGEIALEHPVSTTQLSGHVSSVLTQSLHAFLQTVADLTLLLPAGSSLQRTAIQCFGIRFRQADHQFLHRSRVFGNISKILSRSDEQNENMVLSSTAALQESNYNAQNSGTRISTLMDLQGMFELTVSSRQAMAGALLDNSTETFWESDEEDRNKSKIIDISMNKLNFVCRQIFVHIDNSRDIGNKVQNIMFYAGQSLGDTSLLKSVDIEGVANQGAWISATVRDESSTHFRLVLSGQDPTLRVRSIRLMGYPLMEDRLMALKHNLKLTNSQQIQHRNCEAETLRVFRLITAQVFGKLILGEQQQQQQEYPSENYATVAMESSGASLQADSLDMREHMVGILFSRSKLSHLQKQVIVHIVHAIRKEAQRSKEEWEALNAVAQIDGKSDVSSENSRPPDTYCFEMLSMVLALSGSTVGRSYLSHQYGLLKDLLTLLHTGSDRVQRQVTALLRRMLPEISPDSLGDLLGITKMPPTDFSIVNQSGGDFDMKRLGIIDIFLAVVAKSLQLQVKIKSTTVTNGAPGAAKNPPVVKLSHCIDFNIHNLKGSLEKREEFIDLGDSSWEEGEQSAIEEVHELEEDSQRYDVRRRPRDDVRNVNQRWFLKGTISVKQAENIINLIRDMASGKLTEKWSLVTKAAIAESILNLTRLDEVFRSPEICIKTATLWLALASLCVLDTDHVERLSSGQWSKPSESRPLCSNHDDGVTPAVIQCDACGSLCCDCDRFLHLNRRTRSHHRTVCKEEEEAIRVELHESCGRTKLFWLLALADYKTLKAMVEFRDGSNTIISGPPGSVGRCRFCGATGNSGLLAVGNVCADAQCQEYAAVACAKVRPCGHPCGGVAGEAKCLPCLQHLCAARENEQAESTREPRLTQDADDMCMICFTEALSYAPAIQLDCGHVFHFHCCKAVLTRRWTGPRISFGFSQCPICKGDIQHTLLAEILEPINVLKDDVKRKAIMRLEYEGIESLSAERDLTTYAMDRYAYYVCYKCQKAYYGGEARCDAEIGDNFDPQELVCGGCSDVARAQMCPKHGTDFLEYKCRYCCSVAVFFCFGTTHFCDTCHDDFQRLTNIPKNKLPRCPAGPKAKQLLGEDCPLHIAHPATGEEFALGCGICRNAQTF